MQSAMSQVPAVCRALNLSLGDLLLGTNTHPTSVLMGPERQTLVELSHK